MNGTGAASCIRLTPADADRYVRLRARMLRDAPWAFDATPEDDAWLDPAHVRREFADERGATFAIEAPGAGSGGAVPELRAAASVTRAASPKYAHRARVWGVYVEPGSRGAGLGGAVMGAVIEHARGWPGVDFLDLTVSAYSPEARRLYERAGFRAWGREPETTAYDGRRFDEIFMALRLRCRL